MLQSIDKMKQRKGVFLFQVETLPVIEQDNKQFGMDDEEDLLKQRCIFFKTHGMERSTDLIILILEEGHYFLMCINTANDGCVIEVYNSLHQSFCCSYWDDKITKFFDWLMVIFLFHPMLYTKEKRIQIDQQKPSPRQVGTVDCGLFVIGFITHLAVKGELNKNTFSQQNISKLRIQIVKDCNLPVLLGLLMLTGFNVSLLYKKKPTALHPNVIIVQGTENSIATGGLAVKIEDESSKSVFKQQSLRLQSPLLQHKLLDPNLHQQKTI